MRTESDRFGNVELPDTALYGIQTQRCLENLTCSPYKMSAFTDLIRALAQVKKSAAIANSQAGIIEVDVSAAICRACDAVISGDHQEQFAVDMLHGGGSIAFNQNMNEVLAKLATTGDRHGTVDPKQHVNASQSTADSCSTAFRLAVIYAARNLVRTLAQAGATLAEKAKQFDQFETVARTCMQDAMIVPGGSLVSGWSAALGRRAEHLDRTLEQLLCVNLGGTVLGTGDGAAPGYRNAIVGVLAQVTGLNLKTRENLFDAAQNSDDLMESFNSVSLAAELLIKISADLRLLSSGPRNGFSELMLPAVQDGSSFFAGKVNPVVPETMMQACFHVLGNHRAAQSALEHAELNLNVFESGIYFHAADAIGVLESGLRLLEEKCLCDLQLNQARCADMIKQHRAMSDPIYMQTKGK